MSDLKLVSPDQPTAFEQRLLDAVANESPSAEQRLRVRLALGLPSVVPPKAPLAPVGRRALLLKAAGGLVVVSAALLVLFSATARKAPPAKPLAAPLGLPALVTQEAPAVSPATPPEVGAPSASATAREPHDDGAPSKRPSKGGLRAPESTTLDGAADLSEQLRLIDAARSAVAAGDASAAAVALGSYRARFPRGPFGQEAAVLQIETLELQGNHAEAAARARRFLAQHPNSPHVGVVQRIASH